MCELVAIFNNELCFFPVNTGAHYALCILVTASSTLYYIDSGGSTGDDEVDTIRKKYLACEARRLRELKCKVQGWVPPDNHVFAHGKAAGL